MDIDFLIDVNITYKQTIFREAKNPSLSAKALCLQQLRALPYEYLTIMSFETSLFNLSISNTSVANDFNNTLHIISRYLFSLQWFSMRMSKLITTGDALYQLSSILNIDILRNYFFNSPVKNYIISKHLLHNYHSIAIY